VYLSRRIIDKRQQSLKGYLRTLQNLRRHAVHKVGIVIGKHSRYMQPFTVMLVRLVDTSCERLRQRIDSRYIIYHTSFDKTGDRTPVFNHHFPTETLQEIEHSGMGLIVAEHLNGHRPRCMQMERSRSIHLRHNLTQHMVCNRIDITIRLRQRLNSRRIRRQRACMDQVRLYPFTFKRMMQVCAYAPCSDNSYFHG